MDIPYLNEQFFNITTSELITQTRELEQELHHIQLESQKLFQDLLQLQLEDPEDKRGEIRLTLDRKRLETKIFEIKHQLSILNREIHARSKRRAEKQRSDRLFDTMLCQLKIAKRMDPDMWKKVVLQYESMTHSERCAMVRRKGRFFNKQNDNS